MTKITIFTVTCDGDNMCVETTVHTSETDARKEVCDGLRGQGVTRCDDGQPIESGSLSEITEAWEKAFDGMCSIEAHEIELPT